MVVNRKAVKRKLGDLLAYLHGHRSAREIYRKRGYAAGVERCERLLKLDYSRIRKHCAEYGLELPHDVPDEGAE